MKNSNFFGAIFLFILLNFLVYNNFFLNFVIILPLLIGTIYKGNKTTCIHSLISKYINIIYLTLFVARFFVNKIFANDSYFGRVVISDSNVDQAMLICSIFTISFLCGVLLSHSLKIGTCNLDLGFNSSNLIWLRTYARVGSVLSLGGFFTYVVFSDSLTDFLTTLKMHDKTLSGVNGFANLGLSIWAILSASSVTLALLYSMLAKSYSEFFYIMIIFSVYILILGSRLDLFSVFLNLFILNSVISKRNPLLLISSSLVILILISIYILNIRIKIARDQGGFLNSITYPILDASQVAITQPKISLETTLNFKRFLELIKGYIPRFLNVDKPSIQNLRLDTMVANNFGNEMQRGHTGWPTGAFTEFFIIGNYYLLVVASFLIGIIVSHFCIKVIRNTKFEGPLVLKLLVILGFLLAWYKDGDFLVTIQGSIRLYIYSLVAIFAISKYTRFRDRKR